MRQNPSYAAPRRIASSRVRPRNEPSSAAPRLSASGSSTGSGKPNRPANSPGSRNQSASRNSATRCASRALSRTRLCSVGCTAPETQRPISDLSTARSCASATRLSDSARIATPSFTGKAPTRSMGPKVTPIRPACNRCNALRRALPLPAREGDGSDRRVQPRGRLIMNRSSPVVLCLAAAFGTAACSTKPRTFSAAAMISFTEMP